MVDIDNNYVLARSKEHKLILETLGELESVLRLSSRAELVSNLKAIMESFQKRMELHQHLEESVIFQAAMESFCSEKVVRIVLQLQKEHGIFNAKIEELIYYIWNLDFDDRLLQKLNRELNSLAIMIKKHSLLEVRELFPALSNHMGCKQLIDKYARKFEQGKV